MSVQQFWNENAQQQAGLEQALASLEAAFIETMEGATMEYETKRGAKLLYARLKADLDVKLRWAKAGAATL